MTQRITYISLQMWSRCPGAREMAVGQFPEANQSDASNVKHIWSFPRHTAIKDLQSRMKPKISAMLCRAFLIEDPVLDRYSDRARQVQHQEGARHRQDKRNKLLRIQWRQDILSSSTSPSGES